MVSFLNASSVGLVIVGVVVAVIAVVLAIGLTRRSTSTNSAGLRSLPDVEPRRLSGRELAKIQTLVTKTLDTDLLGRRGSGVNADDLFVQSVFGYGAVDVHPEQLVVWIILDGPRAMSLPAWWFPRPDHIDIDPDVRSWVLDLVTEVRERFGRSDWPSSSTIRVGIEAAERVAEGGGWDYFK